MAGSRGGAYDDYEYWRCEVGPIWIRSAPCHDSERVGLRRVHGPAPEPEHDILVEGMRLGVRFQQGLGGLRLRRLDPELSRRVPVADQIVDDGHRNRGPASPIEGHIIVVSPILARR